jgi:prepilin-type processing-associated H-X9-DG protein
LSWLPDEDATTEMNPSNIVNGVLYQYSHSLSVYHCPADLSKLQTADGRPLNRMTPGVSTGSLASPAMPAGQSLAQMRWRSYNMSQSVNGYPQGDPQYYNVIPTWSKFTDVRHPRPSDLFVFIDENANTIMDAQFGCPPLGSPYFWPNEWWDMPSDRHSQGANLTFVDGHAEHWRWVSPKVAYEMGQSVMPQEMPDYLRIQSAMKQISDN